MSYKTILLPENYIPTDTEEYMNPMQLEYFRIKLQEWKDKLLEESNETLTHLKEEMYNEADPNDRATVEADTRFELRSRDRYRKLINKIDSAIERIKNNTYGYCEKTGQKIGLRRLLARPIATLSIEAQEEHEQEERTSSKH